MRTFVALDLPPDLADDVAALARQLGAAVEGRFLPRSTYHLTLAFLGEVDEAQAARAGDALDAVCANTAPVVLASDGLVSAPGADIHAEFERRRREGA